MQGPKHIVVVRLSAMGDVAMAVPVVEAVLRTYPALEITFVSHAFHAPLFEGIDRCHFYAAHTKELHKGITGMWKLYQHLHKLQRFDGYADLHDVLRSKILRLFFNLSGTKTAVIDKGRAEKKLLTSRGHKQLRQLKTSHERYAGVFTRLGFPVDLNSDSSEEIHRSIPLQIGHLVQEGKRLVGIAPFAKHKEKMYPLEKMKTFVRELGGRGDVQLFFFGAPGAEEIILDAWQQEFASSVNVAGKISLAEELQFISKLSLMISMDSANMHLASMYGIPVVSIWGASHPFAGFYGWRQDEANIVQATLYCRPCSVFGNKPCFRGDHACMHLLTSEMIMQKVRLILDKS